MESSLSGRLDKVFAGRQCIRLTLISNDDLVEDREDTDLARAIRLSRESSQVIDLTAPSSGESSVKSALDDYEMALMLSREESSSQAALFEQFGRLLEEDERLARQLQNEFDSETSAGGREQHALLSPKTKSPNKYKAIAPHLAEDLCQGWQPPIVKDLSEGSEYSVLPTLCAAVPIGKR